MVIALPEPSHNSPHKLWSGSPPPCRRVAESQSRRVAVPLRCLVCWHRLAQQRGPKHWWHLVTGWEHPTHDHKTGTWTQDNSRYLECRVLNGLEPDRTCGNLTAQSMFNRWLVLQRGLVWIYIFRSVRTFLNAPYRSRDRYTGPSGPPACPDALADVAEGTGARCGGDSGRKAKIVLDQVLGGWHGQWNPTLAQYVTVCHCVSCVKRWSCSNLSACQKNT